MNSDWRDQMVVQLIQNSFIFFLKNSVAVCISNKLRKSYYYTRKQTPTYLSALKRQA